MLMFDDKCTVVGCVSGGIYLMQSSLGQSSCSAVSKGDVRSHTVETISSPQLLVKSELSL